MISPAALNGLGAPAAVWHWWTGELKGLLPKQLQAGSHPAKPYLILDVEIEGSVLKACTRKGEIELGRSNGDIDDALGRLGDRPYRRWPCVIRLETGLGLRKAVDLPKVSEEDIAGLLRYELDRLTPFRADDVFCAWRVTKEDPKPGRLPVWLEMAPKAVIQPAIDALRAAGREPKWVELRGDGDLPSLNLLPPEPEEVNPKKRKRAILPPLVIGLAIIAGAIPLRQQTLMIEQLAFETKRARKAAEESVALRDRLIRFADEAEFLIHQRDSQQPVTDIMSVLTQLTPDHSYISQLVVREKRITLVGHADKASDLITALERAPVFVTPRFQSSVTLDPRTGKERFQITAEIVSKP